MFKPTARRGMGLLRGVAFVGLLIPCLGLAADLTVLGDLTVATNLSVGGTARMNGIVVEGGNGDVYPDGIINANDEAVLISYLEGSISLTDEQTAILDINGDAKLSLDDLAIITQLSGKTVDTPSFASNKVALVQQAGKAYGVGTNMMFRAAGTATFDSIILTEPSGDIPMGIFTNSPGL